MGDPRVRKAISHAIDRKAIVEHVLNGHATYINVPINPLSFGVDPSITVPEYNPEKAKQLMKEAGYEDGFECSAWVVGGEYNKATEATMAYLSKINIKLKIREYIGRYGEFAKIWKAGKADASPPWAGAPTTSLTPVRPGPSSSCLQRPRSTTPIIKSERSAPRRPGDVGPEQT